MKTFMQPLSPKEERQYLKMLKEGTLEEQRTAKNILIQRNLRLVAHVVKKYQGSKEEAEDLISIGTIGLIKAIDSFDVERGKLATYACRCIDNELLMMFRTRRKNSKEVSLFEPIGHDKEGNEICLVDVYEQDSEDPVEKMHKQGQLKLLKSLINEKLTDRERNIIILRYGLDGKNEMTQNDIAKIYGISRSYVSRIEKRALEKLRSEIVLKTTK